MQFHQRTLDLFGGRDLALDSWRGPAARRAAAAAGVALPQSVVDWYLVAETCRLWEWYSHSDCPTVRHLPGEREDWWERTYAQEGTLVRDEERGGWWVVPALREDLRGWVRGPILPVVYETQGCCWWGLLLDGTPDPPVLVCRGDQGDLWDHYARSFSDFVFTRVFDMSLSHPREAARTVHLEGHLDGEQIRALRTEFRAEPTTHWGGEFILRFSGDGQRFSLMEVGAARSGSVWHLWAAGPAEFAELTGKLGKVCSLLEGVGPGGDPLYLRPPRIARADDEDQIPF